MKRIQSQLSSIASNPVQLMMIEDSPELNVDLLMDYLFPKISKNCKQLNFLLLESPPFSFKNRFSNYEILKSKKNVIFDFFQDPLGWNGSTTNIEQIDSFYIHQNCPLAKIDDIQKSLARNSKDTDQKNLLYIDSLSSLILRFGLSSTLQFLNKMVSEQKYSNIIAMCNGEVVKNHLPTLNHYFEASLRIQRIPKQLESRANCAIKILMKKKGGKVFRDVELILKNKEGNLKVLSSNLLKNEKGNSLSSFGDIPPGIDKNFFDTLTKEQKEQRDNLFLPFMEQQKDELSGMVQINFEGNDNDEFDEEKWEDIDD